jgi:hypothetical protein
VVISLARSERSLANKTAGTKDIEKQEEADSYDHCTVSEWLFTHPITKVLSAILLRGPATHIREGEIGFVLAHPCAIVLFFQHSNQREVPALFSGIVGVLEVVWVASIVTIFGFLLVTLHFRGCTFTRRAVLDTLCTSLCENFKSVLSEGIRCDVAGTDRGADLLVS